MQKQEPQGGGGVLEKKSTAFFPIYRESHHENKAYKMIYLGFLEAKC